MDKKRNVILFALLLIVFIAILGINSFFNLFHCNLRKELKGKSDTQIHEIREKIAELEKEPVKDVTTVGRLARQYLLLSTLYLDKKMWDMAIDALQNALKYGESGPAVFYQMALAYANRGYDMDNDDDFRTAEGYYRKAIEKHPKYDDALYGLSILLFYHRNGQDEAMTIIAELTDRNPKFYPARFARGRFLYETGNMEGALRIYEKLNEDLSSLPASGIINEYREQCRSNITQIMSEMSGR